MLEVQVHPFANDTLVFCFGRSHKVGRQHQNGIVIKFGGETFCGKFHTVPLNPWEPNLQGITLRPDCPDVYGFARGDGGRDHRFGREIEGDAEHIGIFNVEEIDFVQVVGLTP
ncbi:MAG: hypothetical protein BWY09_01948 [Candidatus Hydrogenedentes bacterium ADurb.Bin179]|nr:MAG: hypothetical protein BWY09_01948 [Candidatus Hydrogenedentes bacterium ADurb.Bin179]